jgi:NIMA (never in mitosis gene a)-related kinase
MAAGRPPFVATDIQTLYKRIMQGSYPRIPSKYTDELSEMISSLLKTDAKDRPSAYQIVNNSIVQRHSQ